MPSVIIFYIRS